jgi:hypothetical protein
MKKFECQSFSKLEKHHIDILQNNSATVAFSRIRGSDYMVATKVHDMQEFKRKLFAKPNRYSLPKQSYQVINSPSNDE